MKRAKNVRKMPLKRTDERKAGDESAEQKTLDGEEFLQSILDTVPDALIVIDQHGIMLSFSATAEKVFGFSAAEVTGRNVSMLMPSPHRELHDSYIERYLESGERRIIGTGRVVVGLRKDGSTFPMELAVGEVHQAARHLFIGFVRDLTERQQTQKRACRSCSPNFPTSPE
jgi:two-component system, LuxR family, sensor kinase FixL